MLTEQNGKHYRNNIICQFVEKKQLLIKLEVIVIWVVNVNVQLIKNVTLTLQRNREIFSNLQFIISVFRIVNSFLKGYLKKRVTK